MVGTGGVKMFRETGTNEGELEVEGFGATISDSVQREEDISSGMDGSVFDLTGGGVRLDLTALL